VEKEKKWKKKTIICRQRKRSNILKMPTNNITAFEEVISIIDRARENSFRAVNRELIAMYWEIGRYISQKTISDNWGKSVVLEFSNFIQSRFVGIKGFSPQNIWRMKQFYETYNENEKLSPLVREITWTNNVLIMMAAKTDEEREFYLEALDRDVKKPNENPSVGVILCAKKDDEVVEYALSRSVSPALIAQYQTYLPQKALLADKLRELRELAEAQRLEDKE